MVRRWGGEGGVCEYADLNLAELVHGAHGSAARMLLHACPHKQTPAHKRIQCAHVCAQAVNIRMHAHGMHTSISSLTADSFTSSALCRAHCIVAPNLLHNQRPHVHRMLPMMGAYYSPERQAVHQRCCLEEPHQRCRTVTPKDEVV